jgi:hypothetical protein
MNAKFVSVEDDAGKVTRYARHANGGGLVAPGAVVADSARIGPMTYVEHGAQIGSGSGLDMEAGSTAMRPLGTGR